MLLQKQPYFMLFHRNPMSPGVAVADSKLMAFQSFILLCFLLGLVQRMLCSKDDIILTLYGLGD